MAAASGHTRCHALIGTFAHSANPTSTGRASVTETRHSRFALIVTELRTARHLLSRRATHAVRPTAHLCFHFGQPTCAGSTHSRPIATPVQHSGQACRLCSRLSSEHDVERRLRVGAYLDGQLVPSLLWPGRRQYPAASRSTRCSCASRGRGAVTTAIHLSPTDATPDRHARMQPPSARARRLDRQRSILQLHPLQAGGGGRY
jgi:hypothetical protein